MTDRAAARDRRAGVEPELLDPAAGPRRYRDPRFDAIAIKVFPGEHYVTDDAEEMLVTVLGSCVSACIRDPWRGIGGMNHFMLPEAGGAGWDTASASMRYGNVAMERLINDLLSRGSMRHRLEVKVFGGGNVLQGTSNIGHRNAEFVEDYLAAEKLPIAATHLRGNLPRRVHYFPATGKVMLLELRRTADQAVIERELAYKQRLQAEPIVGSAELF